MLRFISGRMKTLSKTSDKIQQFNPEIAGHSYFITTIKSFPLPVNKGTIL
jgi:hypothetical protein